MQSGQNVLAVAATDGGVGLPEEQRLAALKRFGVLDTPPEAAFDELTALAAHLCGAPMALVSLVDERRQWFKARLGMDLCETTREVSFCAHALSGPEPLVVEDATMDVRFSGNPLVTGEPHLRFYAGVPLVVAGGHVLGTLCVLDVVPRGISELQLQHLQMLARQVVSQLELRRQAEGLAAEVAARQLAEATYRSSQRVLESVLSHTDVVMYAKDLDGRFILANPALLQLLPDASEVLGATDYDLFPAIAADQFRIHDRVVAATCESDTFAEQLLHPDGTIHGYQSTKFPLYNDQGRVYAVAGVSTDVTELSVGREAHAEAEQRWKSLVESSPTGVAVIAADGRMVYANPQALGLYGVTEGELLGHSALDFITEDERDAFTTTVLGVIGGEIPPSAIKRWRLQQPSGRLTPVELGAAAITYAGEPALQVEIRDMSDQDAAEAALRESERRFRTLFAASPVGSAELLPDGRIVSVNPQLCLMLGYAADELVGQHASILRIDAIESDHAALRKLIDSDKGSEFTRQQYLRKNGTLVDVLAGVAVMGGHNGDVLGLLCNIVDISMQVAAEAALAEVHRDLAARKAFTDALLDNIDVGIVACDALGNLTVFNPVTKQWHGMDLDEDPSASTDPQQFAQRFHLYDADGAVLPADQVPLLRALNQGSVTAAEMIIAPHDRPATRVLCSGQALIDPNGNTLGAVVAMTDITVMRAANAALQASEHRFRTTFANDPAGLAVITSAGKALQVNPAMARILGQTEDALLDAESVWHLLAEDELDKLHGLVAAALRDGATTVTTEMRLHAKGTGTWVAVSVTDLPDPQHDGCVMLQLEDVTARKGAEERLARQALHDSLTDLPNRQMLIDRISTALARRDRRPSEATIALLFCDLDGFKTINDNHGHTAGDAVLVEISRRLVATMRPTDTVARLGGDEFVMLCENLPDPGLITDIAQRLTQAISAPITWRGLRLRVTASVGIAFATRTSTADELIRNADSAMYRAKRLGKDRYEVFDEDLRARSARRVTVESQLRAALDGGGVEVHYQPIYTLPNKQLVAVEALARLRNPDGTMLPPDTFIPVAEDTGMILALGSQVLSAAASQLACWRGGLAPELRCAVNISPRQAVRPDLVETIREVLAATKLPAEALALELTESALLEAAGSTLSNLHELRELGVDVGIDDFGTGYASLSYLRQLPVTFLKVDRSFVAGMTVNHSDNVIVQTVIRLAHALELSCIIEGIETEEQLQKVIRSGAQAQGYLFSKPVPASAMTMLLTSGLTVT